MTFRHSLAFGTALVASLSTAILTTAALADKWPTPRPRVFTQQQGQYGLKVLPNREGVFFTLDERGDEKVLWRTQLVNVPVQVIVCENGKHVVTTDTWAHVGYEHSLVIYGEGGKVTADFRLEDLLTADEIASLPATVGSRGWSDRDIAEFDDHSRRDEFVIRMKHAGWAKAVRVTLSTGELAMRYDEESAWLPVKHVAPVDGVTAVDRLLRLGAKLLLTDGVVREVDITNSTLADADLEAIGGLTSLETLILNGCPNLTNAGLVHVRNLAKLTTLTLERTQITDAGLENLKRLSALNILSLNWTRTSDAGLKHLEGLVNLSVLYLCDTDVGDTGLTFLKGMENLRWLDLRATKVTDSWFEASQSFPPTRDAMPVRRPDDRRRCGGPIGTAKPGGCDPRSDATDRCGARGTGEVSQTERGGYRGHTSHAGRPRQASAGAAQLPDSVQRRARGNRLKPVALRHLAPNAKVSPGEREQPVHWRRFSMSTLLAVISAVHLFAALPLDDGELDIPAGKIRLQIFRDGEAKPLFRGDAEFESGAKKGAKWSLHPPLAMGFATIWSVGIGGDKDRAGATAIFRCEGPEDPDRRIFTEWHVRDREGRLLRYAWCLMSDARIGPREMQFGTLKGVRATVNISQAELTLEEVEETAWVEVHFREMRKEQCAHIPPIPGRHKLGLAMSHPDENGNFAITFRNPPGAKLEPDRHEIALTVSIRDAEDKLIDRRLTFLAYEAKGEYRLPLRIDHRFLETSSVGITVYTKQPDNEAFKENFFVKGHGSSYQGCWLGDGGPIGSLPYEDSRYR